MPIKQGGTITMSQEYITYEEYSTLANRIVGWLTKNQKQFKKRPLYNYQGKEATKETIEIVALDRYNRGVFGADGLVTEYFECCIYDNTDYSFLPSYVTSKTGLRYDRNTMVSMANRVSKYEVEHNGVSPKIVYLKDPNPNPQPTPTKCSNPYVQSTGMATGCNGYGQCTPYYCGCNSLQMAFKKLTGKLVPESTIAGWAGTTTSGTGHTGLNTAVAMLNKKYGYNLKISWKNFSEIGWEGIGKAMCNPNTFVYFHLNYRNKYGHYEAPYKLNTSTGQIQVYNSLGNRQGQGYIGYLETRTFALQKQYINGIHQPSVCIITK